MGSDGFMTAKAISKRIKAKGLGRLRWYCQMCQKQCRDENGFKCHTQSAGHQRQLAIFAESPTGFISQFSQTFRTDFLSVLRQRYGISQVNANSVYQEYIKDRHHIHMNATKWTTLSEFVKDLGKEGLCKVEDRDDGFWIAFVDRQEAERERKARERDTFLLQEEHRADQLLQRQIQIAQSSSVFPKSPSREKRFEGPSASVPALPVSSSPVRMHLSKRRVPLSIPEPFSNPLDLLSNKTRRTVLPKSKSRFRDGPVETASPPSNQRSPTVDKPDSQCSRFGEKETLHADHPDGVPWLSENIIVKVKNNEVGNGAFFGKKGKVTRVVDDFGARVAMFDCKTVLELDQDDLETVIPKAGGVVLLLRGPNRGQKAIVKSINVDQFNVSATLLDTDEDIGNVDYESISRVST